MNLYLTLAWRYLSGRKLRTALTTLAITFGVLVIFGMNTFLPTFVKAYQTQVMAVAGQVDVTITHKTGEAFHPQVLDKVRAVEGVEVASGSLERIINLPADYLDKNPQAFDRITALILKGIDPLTYRQMIAYNIVEGRFLETDDRGTAVITRSLAREIGLNLEDTLALPTATGVTKLKIVGILPERMTPGNEEVLVTLGEAQRLMNMPGKINMIAANFGTLDEARRVDIQKRITETLGDQFKMGALETGSEIYTNLNFIDNGMRSLSIDPKGRILSGVKPNEAKQKRNAKTISPRQFHTSKRQRVALVGKLASRQARALKGLAA